jgi:hypothetical protein
MSKSNGRIWPYAIGLSITAVFGFCVATIIVTQKAHIQQSDAYMTHYQDADANANNLIKAAIAFDKKYKVEFLSDGIGQANPIFKYKITDLNAKAIENANVIVATSRPETQEFNQKLENPIIQNGVYSFDGAAFPKAGIWNIIAKINIGDDTKYFNIKADTRNNITYEF